MVTELTMPDSLEDTCEPGSLPLTYWTYSQDRAEIVEGGVIEEILLSVYVNGQELATLMCSPIDQEALVAGFLFNEGVIQSLDEIRVLHPNLARTAIDVFLKTLDFNPPRRMILTSGCGSGISLRDLSETYAPLESDLVITPQIILDRMHDLNRSARLYQQVRGVHTSILGTAERLLITAEDIGRHNTIDKLAGKALQAGIETRDKLIITSGRISSEMLGKARQMGVPIVASRTAPTSISVRLAELWNICVIGYVRQGGMRIYTHPHRLGLPVPPARD